MRIAFFADNFYPEISGITDSILTLGKELETRGHVVQYYAPHYSKRDYKKTKATKETFSTVRLPSIPMGPMSPTGQGRIAIPIGLSTFAIHKFKPDVIHVHSPWIGIDAVIASRLFKIPLVGTNHTPQDEFMKYLPFHSKIFENLVLGYFYGFYNRCAFVSSPSEDVFKGMMEHRFERPHRAISNPISTDDFVPVDEATKKILQKKYSISSPAFIYSGRLAPEKRIDLVIKAFGDIKKKIPSATLTITGIGPEQKKLEILATRLDIPVTFTGYVLTPILIELYQASDIFAIMSTAESQCLSLMFAMASGVASIAARARGPAEYIIPGTGILVEPGNLAELTEAMERLATNKEERDKIAKTALYHVQQFSPSRIAEIWEKIYTEAISAKMQPL